MSILPANQNKKTVDEPKNFFIYGATMAGKSFFSGHFPNPLFLNTDGNAKANPYPNIQLKNQRNLDGSLKTGIMEQLDQIVLELETQNKDFGYETIVVDVIDDVCSLIEQEICMKNNVESLADIPYGKGFSTFNSVLTEFVMSLKPLPFNVIYVSRVNYLEDNGKTDEIPSLKTKYYNIVNGNCDLVIHSQKIGTKYVRTIKDKRKDYYAENISDSKVLKILKSVTGALKNKPVENEKKEGTK